MVVKAIRWKLLSWLL